MPVLIKLRAYAICLQYRQHFDMEYVAVA